jgi:hypothetical protein
LAEVLDAVDDTTVVFLDVDETLIRAVSPALPGSDQWEKAFTAELESLGVAKDTAWRVAVHLWQSMQHVLPTQPCEQPSTAGAGTASAVALLQSKAACVVGLTARHHDLLDRTLEQLAAAGIVLGQAKKPDTALYLPGGARDSELNEGEDWPVDWFKPNPILIRGGVVACCGPRKSDAVQAYLQCALEGQVPAASPSGSEEGAKRRPSRVVFVDDRLSHLQDVAEAFVTGASRTSFVGFHYKADAAAPDSFQLDTMSKMFAQVLVSREARSGLERMLKLSAAL